MSELSPEARDIIAAARSGDDPTLADRQRVRAALMATIAGSAGAGETAHAAGTPAGATAAPLVSTPLGAKILAGIVLVGGLGVGGYVLTRGESAAEVTHVQAHVQAQAPEPPAPTPEPVPAIAPQPEGSAEPREIELAPVIVDEAPPRARSDRARTKKGDQATSAAPEPAETREPAPDLVTTLREEQSLVSRAKAALEVGDADAALRTLAQHAERFPDGMLAEERAGLRVIAMCTRGDVAEGVRAQASFLARWPSSPLARRVRSACPASE